MVSKGQFVGLWDSDFFWRSISCFCCCCCYSISCCCFIFNIYSLWRLVGCILICFNVTERDAVSEFTCASHYLAAV